MKKLIQNFVNGNYTTCETEPRLGDVYNPALGEQIATVEYADTDLVNKTVILTKEAGHAWAKVPVLKRARVLFNFKTLLESHQARLAQCISEEHGKTLEDAKGEIIRGLEVVEFACGAPQLLKGHYSENIATEVDCHTLLQPVGVCVGITPFNFPAMVPLWMFPVAIACGNSFILKPSEKVPSLAGHLAELMIEAGLPNNILQVLHGDKAVVDALLEHEGVSAASFVGSTPIARYVYEKCAQQGKRVQALGSAKNHCVVMPDADLETAVNGIIGAAFGSAGQRCMAVSVVVAVGDKTADKLQSRLADKMSTIKVGAGLDEQADMGPVNNKAHMERVKSLIATGEQEGAMLIKDGRDCEVKNYKTGYFVGPTLFDHVKIDMKIYQEEIFGPVLSIVRVPDLESAIQLINEHAYGNGTAIYTNSGSCARKFSSKIQVGMIGVNIPIPVPMAFYSFGGWKQSLFGDANVHGPEGINFYTKRKTVTTKWPINEQYTSEFSIPVAR